MKQWTIYAVTLTILTACHKEQKACEESIQNAFTGSRYVGLVMTCDSTGNATEKSIVLKTGAFNPSQAVFSFYDDSTYIYGTEVINVTCEEQTNSEYKVILRDCNTSQYFGYYVPGEKRVVISLSVPGCPIVFNFDGTKME